MTMESKYYWLLTYWKLVGFCLFIEPTKACGKCWESLGLFESMKYVSSIVGPDKNLKAVNFLV